MSKKILIVDDNQDTRFIIKRALQVLGHEFIETDNGKTAVELAKTQLPDLIILDVMMLGLDGIACAVKLKSLPETKNIPIIICTEVSQSDDAIVAKSLGVVDFVRKTSDMAGLLDKVRLVLN